MRMRYFRAQNGSFAPPKNFFFEKIINIIFIYLLAPFILQNYKKILRANPELWGCAIFGSKIPQFVLNKIFWYKPLLLLSSTCWPFSFCKIFKKFFLRIQSYEDAPFLGPKWSICPNLFFLGGGGVIKITLIYLLAPFIVQNFKKNVPPDPELWGCTIFGPKMTHFPKWEFFSENLLMSLVSFIYAYLHAKNQGQVFIYWWNIDN